MKKQISRGVVLSFVSLAISVVSGLVYTPIMIELLGKDEYGLYELVLSVVNYLNLMNFGFNGAYIKYYTESKAKNKEEIAKTNGMFLTIFFVLMLLCLIAGVVLFANIGILGENLSVQDYQTARTLMILMIINLAISFPGNLFSSYIMANERFVFQKTVAIILNVLLPVLSVIVLVCGWGSVGVVAATLLVSIIRNLVNIIFCCRVLKIEVRIGYFNRVVFGDLLKYTFFIFLSDIVDQLNSNVDKLLLGRLINKAAVAVYSVGYNLKMYYTTVSWIIPEMFIPEVNNLAIKEKDDRKLTEVFTRIGRYNNYIILLILTGFIVFGRPFLELWMEKGLGDEYVIVYYSTIILMISGYFPAVQTLGVNIQNAKNLHKVRSFVYFGIACANVGFSIFLIDLWGVVGTCLGTLGAVLIGNVVFMNIYYQKKVKLDVFYFWKNLIKWILISSALCAAGFFGFGFVNIGSWMSLILCGGVYCAIYGSFLWLFDLKKEEKDSLKLKFHLGDRI